MKRSVLTRPRAWISVAVIMVIGYFLIVGSLRVMRLMRVTGFTPGVLTHLVLGDGSQLKTSNGKVNVLLLGIGGGDHDGSDLTDTMLVLSIDVRRKIAALISIPRDIWSDSLKDKVNTAYHYGEEKKKGGGLILTRATAEDVIGMPIYYGFLIDFQGFKTVIDTLGGVNVNVSQTFTDTQYPAPGKEHDSCPGDPTNACVYETVHFDAGMQLMNGDRALIYVRSRHADGAEGSDFARSRRQQEVLLALKNTLLHPSTWITFDRVRMLPKAFDEATDTNISIGELATIGRLFLSIPEGAVKKISFESFLYDPPAYLYGGRSVLTPRDSWESIQEYVASQVQ